MRNNKNNISLGAENITLSYKIIIFSLIILILSLVNITLCFSNYNNVSALSYESNIDIGFTFNPTLSINISSPDLVISNLAPGTTADSNSINVSVATNAAYGYTLSANVNDENLAHTNNTNTFTSIATNADLVSLEEDEDSNIWGYTSKLGNEIAWNNYNGLSSSTNAILLDTNTNNTLNDGVDSAVFKISAKASSTQPSGVYTGTVNFTVVTKPKPISLADAYVAEGKELYHGYYKMQDMSHTICEEVEDIGAQLQVIDIRDDKVYWIAKLADDNCWMTQNLDLDLTSNPEADNYIALTSENTDLNDTTSAAYQDGYTIDGNGVITWIPERSTIAYNQLDGTNWQNSYTEPYSYDRLAISNGEPIYPDNNVSQAIAGDHGLSGNYYNWTASIASNDSNNISSADSDQTNSICPKGWRLPSIANKEFGNLLVNYNIINTNISVDYIQNVSSVNSMGAAPLYFVRGGGIYQDAGWVGYSGRYGDYWSSTSVSASLSNDLDFFSVGIYSQYGCRKDYGISVRCLAR